MKLINVVGARPNFIKIAPIIRVIDKHNKCIDFLRIKRVKKGMSEQNFLLIQQENLRKIWESEDEDVYEV